MYRTYILLLLLITQFSYGQNSHVFNPAYSYNYEHSASADVISNSIFATDTVISGTDTSFVFNTILSQCDTCDASLGGSNPCDTCYYLDDQPQFLQRQFQVTSGTWNFTDTGNIVVPTLAPMGQTWVFDSIAGTLASWVLTDTATLFGQLDSIKVAVIGATDTLILSQSFGLVQFPDTNGTYFTLIGVEGPDVGQLLPGLFEIYDFQVGDVLYYEGNGFIADLDSYFFRYFEKWTITDRQDSPGSIAYTYDKIWLRQEDNTWPHYNVTASQESMTITTLDRHSQLAKSAPRQLVSGNILIPYPTCNLLYLDQSQITIDTTGKVVKGNALSPTPAHTSGLEAVGNDVYNHAYTPSNYEIELTEGLGVTWASCSGLETLSSRRLTGYIENGDTVGQIPSDSTLIALSIPQNSVQEFRVYPNPSSSEVTLVLPSGQYDLQVWDATGRLVDTKQISESSFNYSVENLNSGLYIMSATSGKRQFQSRFQVVK
jgi:uncharacterized membrane protein YeaQ/YmgE (transglycosylase-associated protein family)